VDVLEELMENATVEQVRLKASTEILDRAGVRGGMDLSVDLEVTDARSPGQIVAERLARLAEGARSMQERFALEAEQAEQAEEEQEQIQEAVVVEESSTDK
jgi:hypothetical protein